MAQTSVTNNLLGSMVKDVNPSFMQEGDYIEARNMRIGQSENGNSGCGENIKGTLEIVNGKLTDKSGRYKVVGCATAEAEGKVFSFMRDTIGTKHAIYEFDILTRSIRLILESPALNLTRKIASARYFNGEIVWTDTKTDIKHIFVQLALDGFPYDREDTITLIKPVPNAPITFEPVLTNPLTPNLLLGINQFQFIYRYVFYENQRSVWSMASGTCAVPTEQYSHVKLFLNSSHVQFADLYNKYIQYIEIGVRSDDSQPYRFVDRIDFPTIRAASFEYLFYNDGLYPAIATVETNIFHDDVPLTCKSIEFAEDRFLFGGNTYGQNNIPNITALLFEENETNMPVDNGIYLIQGGKYYVGVVLFDDYDRRSPVYPLGAFIVKKRKGNFQYTQVGIAVSGKLPSWVKRWMPVMTKCVNKAIPLQAHINITSADATMLQFDISFVAPTPTDFAWVYSTGDRFSLLTKNAAGDSFASDLLSDLPLLYDTGTPKFQVKGDFTGIPTGSGAIGEFYTPTKELELNEYFEIGLSFPVVISANGDRFFGSNYNGSAHSFVIEKGDTFWNDIDKTQRINLDITKYQTWFHGIGRVNTISLNPIKQQYNGSEIAYSDPYVQGTGINGLNAVGFASKKTYPLQYGNITALALVRAFQANGDVMLVVTTHNCFSVYFGKIQTYNTDGSSNLVASEQLLGTANLLAGGFGTLHPESVHVFGTTATGWDAIKGVWWRYSQDGLTDLTEEYGYGSWAEKKSRSANPTINIDTQVIVGASDPYFDERMLSIGDNTDNGTEVLAFNNGKKGFATFYDMNPDWMCTLNDMVVSWKNGVLYLHRAGDKHNVLQDRNVKSSIRLVSKIENVAKSKAKAEFNTINAHSLWIFAQDEWSVKIQGIARTRAEVQKTQMDIGVADEQEDKFCYPILQDQEKLPMKSRYFIVDLEIQTEKETILYGMAMRVSDSQQNV